MGSRTYPSKSDAEKPGSTGPRRHLGVRAARTRRAGFLGALTARLRLLRLAVRAADVDVGAVQGEALRAEKGSNVKPHLERSARRGPTLVRVVEGARPGKALDDHILNTPPKQVARTGVEYVSVVFAKMLKTR